MPRHWYVRPRIVLPQFDIIEAVKTTLIWIVGTIYFVLLGCIIVAGFWIYATSKAVT